MALALTLTNEPYSKARQDAKRPCNLSCTRKPLTGMADVAYGPTRLSSAPLLPAEVKLHLPNSHLEAGLQGDAEFWADHGETLSEKFNEWLLK